MLFSLSMLSLSRAMDAVVADDDNADVNVDGRRMERRLCREVVIVGAGGTTKDF